MKIAFNPSTVAALTSPPNNKDITFDLRGRNIFARGVKFQGTDTNTWRSIQINGTSIGTNILNIIGATASTKDGITSIITRDTWRQIKINNISIGTNTLDLRNGTNVTLVNNNGIVTISSTWRPVVDNLTSTAKDQSLSANMGRYLKSLIDSTNSTISDKYALRDGSNATGRWRGGLACLDVRNSEKKPQDLNMGLDLYFYANNTNGLKDGGSYNGVFSFRQWSSKTDWSGGKAHQLGFTDNSHLWHRSSKDSDTWNEWQRIAYYNEIPTSLKNPYTLTLQANSTTIATYDGSFDVVANFTYSNIGAASASHNHDGRYVHNYGSSEISGSSLNNNALFMTTSSGITKDWWHILQAAWNNEYRWNSQIAFPTQNRNGVYYRSGLNDNTKWGAWVKLLDVDNYASILDSRYYTESEINNKLSTKLDRVNLSTSSWNPRGYNLAADYHYNGGDVSFAESGGQMHISIDGKFWQNEGQYKVLDTSDLGGIYSNVNLQQYISNTDTAWYPIVWGGSSHRNTNSSTGQLYKSHDKLSWQTSSQTLYTTNLQTLGITFPNSGTSLRGIQGTVGDNDYWRIMGGATSSNNGYLEIATADDGTEPIYIRQYTGVFSSVKRTLTLLDANGFSYFPSYINIGGNENNNSSPDRVWGSNSSDSFLRSYRTSALRVAYSKYLSGISLTGGNNNNAGYRLIFQRTMGGWTINYGVWAIAFRHSGRGVLNIGFDTTNSDGSSYTYDIRFFGSITSKESTPFRAFYNTTTKVLRIYWHYYDYTSGDIALLRGNIEPSNGTWMTSLPSDVGNELTIVYNRVSYADDSDKVDGYHATDGRTFTGNINWGSWNDVWSDGTHSHPWYGFDHRYSNTGVYSTTLSDYFGMTLKTANTLQFAVGSSYFQFGDSVLKLYSDGSGNTERVYLQANIDGRTDNYDIASYGGEQRHSIVLNPRGGYVGIGVSSPSHKLHINNTMRIDHGGTAGIYLYSSSGESSFSMQANGGLRWVAGAYTNRYFIWDSNGGESFSILNNHNVGIGTTSPAYRLDVSGSARITSQLFMPINGNYQAILMGDDCWLGDCNIGNVIGLSGTTNANAGGIKFGKGGMYIGYNGSNHYASSTSVWSSFNADMVDGLHVIGGSKPYGGIPYIGSDGVMEVGKYLDFHNDNTSGWDYSTRLQCTENYANIVYLPSASGTLALTSQIPTVTNYYWANVKISTSSNTQTQPSVNTIYANNWFRSQGSTGWYNESYGGGIFMQDSTWIRTWGSKSFYCNQQIYSSGSIRMSSLCLQYDNEINNINNSTLYLNYRNSGNVHMCRGGGAAEVGNPQSASGYKLKVYGSVEVQGHVLAYDGFKHNQHDKNDAILLAGGGYSIMKTGSTSYSRAIQISNFVWIHISIQNSVDAVSIVPSNISNPKSVVYLMSTQNGKYNYSRSGRFYIMTNGVLKHIDGELGQCIYETVCYYA